MEANQENINQENMETFVAVDDDGNRVPVQVVRSGDNLVIFLNEGQSIEGVTSALQGMADGGAGGNNQYQIMVTDNYQQGDNVQVEGVQSADGFQQIGDGTQVLQTLEDGSQVLQTVEDGSQIHQQAEDGSQILQTVQDGSQVLQTEDGSQVLQQVEGEAQEAQPAIDMEQGQTFGTETYQQYQVDEMVEGVQGVQVQAVSEGGEVMDAFVPAVAQAEGQEMTAVTTFISTVEGGTENSFVSAVASGSESEGVSAFVSAVASGFQEPGGSQQVSNLPNVNIPMDGNLTQYDQTAVTYAPAEISSTAAGVDEGQYEQATFTTAGTTIPAGTTITDQYGQTLIANPDGTLQYADGTQITQQGVVTSEVPEGHLQIDLQRKPIEVVTDIGDLIVQQQQPTGTTAAIQTQIDRPFIATKVTNVAGSVIGQKITQQTITPGRTQTGKGQGVSILLKCEKCDQVFFTASDLKSHREKVHGATVGKIGSMVESRILAGGDTKSVSHLCNICHIICANQNSLMKHKHDKHGMDMPFKCDQCNYSTTQKKYLDVHVKTHQKVHKCSVCDNKFESEEKLKRHMTTHSRDKYQCFYCSKMYLTRKACTDHIALKHSGPQKNVQFVETKKEVKPAASAAAASTQGPLSGQSTAAAQTDYDTIPGDTLLAGATAESGFGDNLLQDNLDQLANVAAAQATTTQPPPPPPPKVEEPVDDGKTEEEKVSEALQALEEASATYKYTEETQSATDAISYPDDFPGGDDAGSDDDAMDTSSSQATDGKSDLEKLAAGAVDIKPGPSIKASPTKAPAGLEDYTPLKNRNFECLGCYSQFATELLFQNHFLKEHCDENVCLLCGRDFAKRYLVRVHFHESHCNKDVYKCRNCDKKFNMVSKYWQHAQIHARRHVCRICSKAFSSATEMKRHETSVHYNKSYFCVYCPETFTSALDLRLHKEEAHNIKRHGNVKKDTHGGKTPSGKTAKTKTEVPETIVAGSTAGSAKNLIQQAKDSGTQMTIKIFRDGTYQTTDPNTGKTDSGTIDLSNLGLDPSLLQTHNDLELVIIPPDKDDSQEDSAGSSQVTTPKTGSSLMSTPKTGTLSPDGKAVVNGDRTFSCSFCPRTFRFYRHLRCHENAHGQDEKYVCHICQRMFVREANLKLHLELHEKKTAPPSSKKKKKQTPEKKVDSRCEICGKVFTLKSRLTRHMNSVHSSAQIKCQLCDRTFRSESNAQRHMKQHFGPFPCTYCSEIFTDKDILNDHVKEKHQIKLHTCHVCGKEMFSFGKLLSHLKIIHPEDKEAVKEVTKEIKCDICDKKFSSSKSVRAHRLTHTGEKKYQCPHCPWKFYQSYKLQNHIKVHEKMDTAPPGKKTRFPCDFCIGIYRSEAAMERHESVKHKGPFQCQVCKAKKFPDKIGLKVHAVEKHGGNCFKCDICELLFTSGRNLQIHHMSSHNKSHVVCDKCGYSFTRKDEMYEHVKFMHFNGDEELFRAEFPDVEEPVEKIDYEELKKTKTCPRCDRSFSVYKGLMSHMKVCKGKKEEQGKASIDTSMEDDDMGGIDKDKLRKNPQCPDCGKKFSQLAAVLSHMRYCKKGIKHPCNERGKGSKSSPSKVKSEPDEILSDSADYVPYTYLETGQYVKCDKCQKTFSKRESLKKHMLKHAGISTKKPEAAKSKSSKPEKTESSDKEKKKIIPSTYYDVSLRKCVKCKMTFTNLFSLKRHLGKQHPEAGIRLDTKIVDGDFQTGRAKKVDTEPKTEEELKEIAKNNFLQMNFALGIKTEPSSDLTSPVVETVKTKRHDCSLCGLKFSREATLKKHLVEIHNEEDFYEEPESYSSSDSDSMETQDLPPSPVKTRRMRDSLSSTPKIKTEPVEEQTPRTSERQRLKKGVKEATPKFEPNKKIKKEVEEVKATPTTRSTLSGRKLPKQKTPKKEVFTCQHCERTYDFKKNLDRHLKYHHKDIKKIVSSLSTIKALRNTKNTSHNLRVKKKLASLKAKPKKPFEWPEPETKHKKIKQEDDGLKKSSSIKEMRQKVQSKAATLKQSKPKSLVSSKAKHSVKKPSHKSEPSKPIKTPKPSHQKKPKKMPKDTGLGGIMSKFLKKRVSAILYECEFCKQQFPDKVKLNFHRRTKHSSKVISKSICECNVCSEVFTELRLLLSHMANKHSVEPRKVQEIKSEPTFEVKQEVSQADKVNEVEIKEEIGDERNKEPADEVDAVPNDQIVKSVIGDESASKSESPSTFALDSDLTSQYIELQKNGGHKEMEAETSEETFLESICSKSDEPSKDEASKSSEASASEQKKPDPFLPGGESHMEMDSNLPSSTPGDKFLDEDAEVESLTNPVVHDVDMFTGAVLLDGKTRKRTDTPVDGITQGSGRSSRQSSKSGTPSLKDKNKPFLKQCQVCLKRFHTEIGYSKHIHTHTQKKYECPKCDAFFRWEKNLKSHVKLFHSDAEVLVCKVCSKLFHDKELFEKHQIVHMTRKFPCRQCKKNFSKQSLLKDHITEVHKNKDMQKKKNTSTELSCGACNLKFETIEKLLNHILLGHTEKKPAQMLFRERLYKYRCKFCPLLFKSKESQDNHMKVCDKRMMLIRKLYGYEVTDSTCSVCGLKFKSKTHAFKHMQAVHGNKSKFQHIDFLKQPTLQTKYICEGCNGTFARYSSFMMHDKGLLGICSKKKKSSKHERCPFCKVLFGSRLILGKHMIKIHNNYLFYSWKHCPYCNESFSKRINLRKHLQSAHVEEMKGGKKKKSEGKKPQKKEVKGGKSDLKKAAKKSVSGAVSVSQLVKKTPSTSKESEDTKSNESTEQDSKYRKIRTSTGIERHKCEYCGRVSWTIGSYEEHLSKYHADRWIEKSIDSPGTVGSPMADSESDDKKLGKQPVVRIQRLPADLLVKGTDNLAPKEKENADKYLGTPYSFDDGKKESSETTKDAVIDLPLVDLDSVENLPDLPLEPPATKTDSEGNDLQKEEVEDYLKPVTSGRTSTDAIGFPESLPDEILASSTGTPVKSFPSGSQTESAIDSTTSQEESAVGEESEDVLTEMEGEGNTVEEKAEAETENVLENSVTESELLGENGADDGIEYQEMTEDVTAQFESEAAPVAGLEVADVENGNKADYGMGIVESALTTSGIGESAYEEMEYEEMQVEGVGSSESHPDKMGTEGLQDENLGDYMEDPLETMMQENGNV